MYKPEPTIEPHGWSGYKPKLPLEPALKPV